MPKNLIGSAPSWASAATIVLFLLSLIFASNASEIYVTSTDNHTEPLPTCGDTRQSPCSLADGISRSVPGDTVVLLTGFYPMGNTIFISKQDLSIIADSSQTVTIGARPKIKNNPAQFSGQPAFIVNTTGIIMKGIRFENFQTNVIIVSGEQSSVSFEDCAWHNIHVLRDIFFIKNYIKFNGAAGLAVYSDSISVSFRHCRFRSIQAENIQMPYAGLAIYAASTRCIDDLELRIENCEFHNITTNVFEAAGGAVYLSRPTECSTGAHQLFQLSVWISNSSFDLIQLGPIEPEWDIDPSPTTASSATFGASLAIRGPAIQLNIINSSFSNNFVRSGSSYSDGYPTQGVAVFMQNNRVYSSGIDEGKMISSISIVESRFLNNTGFGGRAGASSSFYFGSAGLCAGAGVFLDGLITSSISYSSFWNNSCFGGAGGTVGGDAYGAAVAITFPPTHAELPKGSTWAISDSIFENNSLYGGVARRGLIDRGGSRAFGGAVYMFISFYDRPIVPVKNSIFRYNSASGGSYGDANGGAIAFAFGSPFQSTGHKTVLFNNTMSFNTASGGYASGGAVSFSGDITGSTEGLQIDQSLIYGNRAIGGAEGASETGDGASHKSRCRAEGGAIFVVSFSKNHVWDALSVSNSGFYNNSAIILPWVMDGRRYTYGEGEARGGAIHLTSNMMISIRSSEIINNTVSCVVSSNPCVGGALSGTEIRVASSVFQNNSVAASLPSGPPPDGFPEEYRPEPGTIAAPVRGGAVYATGAIQLEYSRFVSNSVNGSLARGGALYSSSLDGRRGCNFTSNTADSHVGPAAGGAVYVQNDNDPNHDVIGSDFIFFNNRATSWAPNTVSYGGAIHSFMDKTDRFFGALFIDNHADYGGAIDIGQLYHVAYGMEPQSFINNTATIAGSSIMFGLNENIDERMSFEPIQKNITYAPSDFVAICNGTAQGNIPFCGLTIDQMILSKAPPRFLWPGKLFKSVLRFVDLLGRTVMSESSLIEASAFQKGVFLGEKENGTISIDLAHAGILHVDEKGEYSFADLRLHSAPASSITLEFTAINGPGVSQILFPTYQNTPNHTFTGTIHYEVTVAPCPPGFILEKLSGGIYDCVACPTFTYSIGHKQCLPCGESEEKRNSEPSAATMSCLISPTFDVEQDEEIWVIPRGFFPVPSFEEAEEILKCPNPSACKQYNCTIKAEHKEHGGHKEGATEAIRADSVKWNLDCSIDAHLRGSNASYCAKGYTDRLCSRCFCNLTNPSDCFFATGGEEFLCRRCETPSTAVIAVSAIIIVFSLVGFLLFQNSAVAIFVAEVLIAILLLVLGLGEWWFFDVIIISTVLFLISRSATKYLKKKKPHSEVSSESSATDDSEANNHDQQHEESAYFVGIIKVSIFFLQTTSAILPKGTWPSWVIGIVEALNSISLRIAGVECFNPNFFSVPAIRFATLMAAPVVIILAMGFATILAVLLSRLSIVQRLQALEARFSLRKCFGNSKNCCKKSKKNQGKHQEEHDQGNNVIAGAAANVAQENDADNIIIDGRDNDDLIAHSDAESDVEESLLAKNHLEPRHDHPAPSYWSRFQYSLLFVLFASQFELSNAVLSILRPCEHGYMAAHPWIACSWSGSTQYVWLNVLGYIFMALYVVGIPLTFFALLVWNRSAIRQGSEEVEQRMGFLYETYKRDVFFFEVIWLLRRVLLSISIALIPGASSFRSAAIALILLASLFIQQRFRPFSSRVVNALEIISTTTLLYSFFVASMVVSTEENSIDQQRGVMQTLLWVLNALVVVSLGVALIAPAVQRLIARCCCKSKRAFKLK